ncbi:MAG TPA: hypothetical protein VNN10_05315 [Dehalococcoidia bacterium]|nr:hypothetical protein [Dehalococcoidia bacterium]
MTSEQLCAALHTLLDALPMHHAPGPGLPDNGLYFFYEDGEVSDHTGLPRVVRVGNHPRSQNGLVSRLRLHYSGTKNSSVFRRLLGGALMRRADPDHPCLQPAPGKGHWEKQSANTCVRCRPTEAEVSRLLREKFRFRCVRIDDMRERNDFEARLIACLSQCPRCHPSAAWLGQYAYSQTVRDSGLWNSQYVRARREFGERDLKRIEVLVKQSISLASPI